MGAATRDQENMPTPKTSAKTTDERAETKAKPKEYGLVGRCFVTFNENNEVSQQGIVRGKISDAAYLVQYFEWIMGEPSIMQIVELATMMSEPGKSRDPGKWIFFEDTDHMNFWIEQHPNRSSRGE
jgi:hypothetical protein